MGRNRVVDIPSIKIQPRCAPTAAQAGSASNRPSPRGIVRFDHLGFRCPDNPGVAAPERKRVLGPLYPGLFAVRPKA